MMLEKFCVLFLHKHTPMSLQSHSASELLSASFLQADPILIANSESSWRKPTGMRPAELPCLLIHAFSHGHLIRSRIG